MSKKLFFCIVIIILIIAGIYTANTISKKDQTVKTATNTAKETNETDEKNAVANNRINDVDKQEIENKTARENSLREESPEEKAIRIVKENWGEDDTVYFACEEKKVDGKYQRKIPCCCKR